MSKTRVDFLEAVKQATSTYKGRKGVIAVGISCGNRIAFRVSDEETAKTIPKELYGYEVELRVIRTICLS